MRRTNILDPSKRTASMQSLQERCLHFAITLPLLCQLFNLSHCSINSSDLQSSIRLVSKQFQ